MSGQPPPSSAMPPQPQPFRFWLPYRSNAGSGSSRQQPWPPQPPPPPTPAERAPRTSPAMAMREDVPIQGESSDESDTIPVQSLDSPPRWRRARTPASMPNLELTLSRSPRGGGDGGGGNDTKIAISGFPRSRLFDGDRAPYRREIEDGLKSLAGRDAPAARTDGGGGQGYRVITLAGHNVGASMVLGGGGGRENAPETPAAAANVNSNVQSVNNSSMEASTCNAGDPGVRVDIKNARDESVMVKREEEKPKESPARRRPPLAVAPPTRARRCLRALMMESGSDTEAAPPKPKPGACRFQCVADHAAATAPAATTSNGGGGGGDEGKSGEEGGKENSR
uniref:Uncharacterized protein n=1 Tax=Leersia perrieri TaxID=77586 RepID=A0A0D9XCJ3_9ORYZ